MTKKFKSQHQKQKQDPDLREVKYILIAVGLIMLLYVGTATLGQQAQPLRFMDGVIQYAEGAEFYVPPNERVFATHGGLISSSCPTITGPASATTTNPPSSSAFYLSNSITGETCTYPIFIWDDASLIPRIFDPIIDATDVMYSMMDWGSADWNNADGAGGGIGCSGVSVANVADPRINVTATYEAIRGGAATVGGIVGACDIDIQETTDQQLFRNISLDEDYINRVNDTYYAIGGKLGTTTGSRDAANRWIDLTAAQFSLNFAFQVPADYSNNWWQLQEHPMYINHVGTPTGDQFSDNSPQLIDSGFFGIDDITFTMDTGLDNVERGQVVLFKQFNKANLLGGGWDITSIGQGPPFVNITSQNPDASTIEDVTFSIDGLKMYLLDTQPDDEIDEYDLSVAWDITTAVLNNEFDVSSENISPEGLDFSPDGKRMVMLGGASDAVFLYELSTAWNTTTATYTGKSGDVSVEEAAQNGLAMKPDGLKMYISGTLNDRVYEYDLTTAWDVSTATFLQDVSVATNSNNPEDVEFRNDGLVMLLQSDTGNDVDKYILSTAWDVTSATFDSTVILDDADSPFAFAMKPDGLRMYVSFRSPENEISQYDLTSTSDSVLPDIRVKGGIQSVGSLGDTKIHIEVRDHPLQAGQTQFVSEDVGVNQQAGGTATAIATHDGQDYFHKNRPIKFLNNGSLGVIEIEPTLLGAVEPFDFSLKPFWDNSISDIVTVIVSLQDNSTTGSLIANITSIEIEDVIKYNFTDINELLFFEDNCSSSLANVDAIITNEGNDENCGSDLSNGLVHISTTALEGVSGLLLTPEEVENLTVKVMTDDTLLLNWDHNQGNTTGYRIDRDSGAGLVTYIKNTAVSSQSEIPAQAAGTYGTGTLKRDGVGGSIDTTFTDINYNVTNYPSRANAFGLEDNTLYSYRVCALNGDLVGTCSSTVGQTTPDSEPFWQVVENSDGLSGTGGTATFEHNGGDGDWLKMRSGLVEQGGRDGVLIKSFNIAEYGLIENNSFPMFHIDWVGFSGNHVRRIMFCDGDFNRFSTNPDGLFQIRKDNGFHCVGHNTVANPTNNDGTGESISSNDIYGGTNQFHPYLTSHQINLNSTFFPSGFVTVMIGARDRVNSVDQGFDIKNFTWVNSTSWEFEVGNGASLNWTAGVSEDNQNNRGYSYSDPEYANCNAGRASGTSEIDYKFVDHTFDCDLGTVFAPSIPHQVLREVKGVNDWQYHESQNPNRNSFHSMSSDSEGLNIDASRSRDFGHPANLGKMWFWNEFDSSVLQEGNLTIGMSASMVTAGVGSGIAVQIFNTTVLTPNDASFDRWSQDQWSENGHVGNTPQGPTPINHCVENLGSTCMVTSLDTTGNLTARDGEAQAPWDSIIVTGDFSNLITTDRITIMINWAAAQRQGTLHIQNLTVGLKTYDFVNSTIKNEIGENQFLRVAGTSGSEDYQFYEGTNMDRGLITAGAIIIEPPSPPTNVNATAVNPDVVLEWDAVAGADDYKIERSGALGPLSIENLWLNFNFDNPDSRYNTASTGNGWRWGNDNRTQAGEFGGMCDLDSTCVRSKPAGSQDGVMSMNVNFGSVQFQNDAARIASTSSGAGMNGTGSDYDFFNSGDWSVNAWIHPVVNTASSPFTLYMLSTIDEIATDFNDRNGIKILIGPSGNTTDGNFDRFLVQALDDTIDDVFVMNETSPIGMYDNDSEFHMFTIVHKNGEYLKWYRDGVLLETDVGTPLLSGTSDFPVMMAGPWGTCYNFENVTNSKCTLLSGLTVQTHVDEWSVWKNVIEDSDISILYGGGLGHNFTGNNIDGDDGSTEFTTIAETVLTRDGNFATADFYDDFSTDQGWLSRNETFMFLDTNLGFLNMTKKVGDPEVSNMGGVHTLGQTIASINIAEKLGEDIGDTFTLRVHLVVEEVDDINHIANITNFGSVQGHHSGHHSSLFFRPWAITNEDVTTLQNDFCRGIGSGCLGMTIDSQLKDWQISVSNATNTIVPGTTLNININAHLNEEHYYIEMIKGPLSFQTSVFTDAEFTHPHACFNHTLFVCGNPPTVAAAQLLDKGGFEYPTANGYPPIVSNLFEIGAMDYLVLGGENEFAGITATHEFYTGQTFGFYGYYDEVAFFNNVNLTGTTRYVDDTVDLGTNYQYRISAIDTLSAPGSPATSLPSDIASVLTNDIPAIITNILSIFATPFQIDIQWDALPFNSGEGFVSSGLNLTKYKLFRENVTAGEPFELLTELLATSPPLNFFNDTSVSFPQVYNFITQGCNLLGCGSNSTTSAATVTDPPSAVLDTPVFNATAVNNTVSLDWNDSTFAINYTVLRNSTIIAQGVPTSNYIDTTVSVNTNYIFSAWGVNDNGNGTEGFSNLVTTNDVPSVTPNFTATMGLISPFLETPILNWTSPVDQGDGNPTTSVPIINYTVERKQGIGAFSFLKNETNVSQLGTTDDTAIVAVNYTWKTKACNIVGCGPFSNTDSLIVTPTTVPLAAENLTATTLSGTEIFLAWDGPLFNASNQPTEYRIQQRHVGFTGFVTLFDTGDLLTNNTIAGLLSGNTYDFRVAGLSGAGQGPYSNIAQNITFSVPTSPLNLNTTSLSQTSIFLDWIVPATTNGGILQYDVEIESPIGNGFTSLNNTVDTNYTAIGLTTKTEYNFRVNATNLIGTGPYSNEAANTTFGVPDPPINLGGSTDGINEITVEWDQPLNNYGSEVTGYRIDQAQGIGGTWITAIANTGNNIEPLEETFVGLLPQTNYVFRIFAFNSFGISPASANLTQGTIIGPSEPENVFAVFNATKPYSVFISWDTPLSDGGKTIVGYLVQRLDESSVFQLISNITDASIKNFTDTNLLNLATHTYKVAAYSNPTGSFSADQPVATVVIPNFINFTIDDFEVVGDVLRQDYTFIIDDCFPACTFSQTDIERNGVVESNIPFNTAVPLDSEISFTTWFILPDQLSNSINTTAFVTNLGSSEDDEAGVTLATAEFLVPTSLFFNHTRTADFEFVNFTLIRHPVPWNALCEFQNGAGFGVDSSPFGDAGTQPFISLQNVGFFDDQLDVVPTLNTYVACFDPDDNQILSFTSFGFGNGSLALVSFTSQLGDFMGVPVPFIFIVFLAAIWTGRSASTGIIFLSIAIGAMGVLGYFPGLDGNPLLAGTFWSLIVLLTALGVLVGKRFF